MTPIFDNRFLHFRYVYGSTIGSLHSSLTPSTSGAVCIEVTKPPNSYHKNKRSETVRKNPTNKLNFAGGAPPPQTPPAGKNGTAVGPSDGRPTAVQRPSDGQLTIVRRPSDGHPTTVRRPSDDRPTTIRRPSEDRPTTVRPNEII